MFYSTKVLDISYNLLEDLIGSDCNDISETRILNVSSNMIDFIDESFPVIMKSLEEFNNPQRNIERYEIGINTQLQKLMLANSGLLQIDIKISLPLNVHLIDLRGNRRIRRVNVIIQFICRHPLGSTPQRVNPLERIYSLYGKSKSRNFDKISVDKSPTLRENKWGQGRLEHKVYKWLLDFCQFVKTQVFLLNDVCSIKINDALFDIYKIEKTTVVVLSSDNNFFY
ncbi:hypothetical protein GJ496_006922 [Pomphorhynchus laevis]|nr:hypothetical protein GJ496_006922 [Pomphorhynchus laevis]